MLRWRSYHDQQAIRHRKHLDPAVLASDSVPRLVPDMNVLSSLEATCAVTLICMAVSPSFVQAQTASSHAGLYCKVEGPRIVKTINRHWTFNYFPQEDAEVGYEAVAFDDSRWPAIAIPHTWSTYETTGEVHPFIRNPSEKDSEYFWNGWGWYRKRFVVSQAEAGRKVFVEFDGVQKYCRVWLNGEPAGEHKGGFSSFSVDVTDRVCFGEDNVLAVAVSNRRNDRYRIPPMTAGNWNVYGGIYRDVRVVIKDRLHIPFQGSARHGGGTFVTTPTVSTSGATVRVRTWVKNEHTEPKDCELTTVIADAQDHIIQVLASARRIEPGVTEEFDQVSEPIAAPRLWSVEHPYVYSVYSELREGDRLTDHTRSPLGFRWFEWNDEEDRLYLNGQRIHIHGTNRHQEYPWLGDAIPKWIHGMDLKDIRFNLGHNFLRTCHYSQDPYVYDLCDRYGLIVCEEVPNIKSIDFSEPVQEQQVREMIRRDRNHPCILFWSMGNETNDAADSRWAVEEDDTRIIHARHVKNDSAGEYANHTHEQMDMENLLRCTVRGWTNADVKNLEPPYNQHTGHEEWQHQNARIRGRSQRGRIDMGNGVMWLYADHGADREYKDCPLKHINPKGWVDAYRVPKYMYYLWQANYAEEPMVFVHPHFWRARYAGQTKDIIVDSNCDNVELKTNGISRGVLHPTAENFHTVTFKDVLIEPGVLTAEGTRDGRIVRNSVTMAGEPIQITLTTSHTKIPAGLDSVAIVKADVVDADGVHVYGATHTIRWSVAGPATRVGPAIYESDIEKHEQMDGVMYIDTPVCNLIRSSGTPGAITVRAMASGLAAGSVTIIAEPGGEDALTAVIEPPLPKGNRTPVARDTAARAPSSRPVPREMKDTLDDWHLQADSVQGYAGQVRRLLVERNPDIDPAGVAFRVIVDVFARHLHNNGGELVADDYNFIVAHYNNCRRITRFIDTTQLPPHLKKALKEQYARQIIEQGVEKDFDQERRRINARYAR